MERIAIYTANEDVFFNQGGAEIFGLVMVYGVLFAFLCVIFSRFRFSEKHLWWFAIPTQLLLMILIKKLDLLSYIGDILSMFF